ncbi:RNA polymerase sigma factor [Glutamicibacter halophytocola]|uniref:RNA polymerase sigma factor n=1 Tax=Glutamicibacter halophytocola TaxID=1933880 RepID=UPI003D2D1276
MPPWRVPGPSALPRPRPGGAKAPRDAQLVSEIYREHADALRRFALRGYCGREEADDVVQETVLKVWKAAPEITGSLRGYLFATARHVIIDEHRRAAARIHADLLGDADPAAAGAEDGNVQVLDRLLMQQALMRLSAEHRLVVAAFALFRFHGGPGSPRPAHSRRHGEVPGALCPAQLARDPGRNGRRTVNQRLTRANVRSP